MTSAVMIGNLALDEIPHRNIVSLDDNVLAADVIKRQLPQVLGEAMESGDWSFGVKRVALSEITNTRSTVWRYAYAVPSDMAMPLKLSSVSVGDEPYVGPGQTLAAPDRLLGEPVQFDFEARTIWTNERGALLEYITLTPAWTDMSRRFMRVLALILAARIVVPIMKDHDRKRALLQEAELYGQRALANDKNTAGDQNRYGDDFIPSALRGYFTAYE